MQSYKKFTYFWFESSREALQINILNHQLGLGSQLKKWYRDETSVLYGHLFIQFNRKTVNSLKYYSNRDSIPTNLFTG